MLEQKLEEIKKLCNYNIILYYGEGNGCDDMDVKMTDRNVVIVMSPAGYLGELRKLYKGKYKDFINFDFSSCPKVVQNPPTEEDINDSGYYVWGTEDAIKDFL